MNGEFPLEYTHREGIVFDVSAIRERDIASVDVDLSLVGKDRFVAFRTGIRRSREHTPKDQLSVSGKTFEGGFPLC